MPCHLLSTGRFWMSWTDFCEIFDEVEVCPMDECAKKARLDSRKFSLLKEEIRCLSTVKPSNRQASCYFCRRRICHPSSNSLEVPRSKVAAPSWVYGGQCEFPKGCDDFDTLR